MQKGLKRFPKQSKAFFNLKKTLKQKKQIMKLHELIEKIHKSDTYGCFIEMGGGQPLAQKLFEVEGASKTVYLAESPYSKEYQIFKYQINERSVSKEAIKHILECYQTNTLINTVYTCSFQIKNEPNAISHGWIGLKHKETMLFYHITLPPLTRKGNIDLLGKLGVLILKAGNDLIYLNQLYEEYYEELNLRPFDVITFDMINGVARVETLDKFNNTLDPLLLLNNKNKYLGNLLTINSNGKIIRTEELIRGKDLILFKGSFNPPTLAHTSAIKQVQKLYSNATACFSISTHTYEKGKIKTEDLIKRINLINKLGYPVILFDSPYFNYNIKLLRANRSFNNEIILCLGNDTLNRVFESSYSSLQGEEYINLFEQDFRNTKFCYFERPGVITSELIQKFADKFVNLDIKLDISSTKVRNKIKNKEDISGLVPAEIFLNITETF